MVGITIIIIKKKNTQKNLPLHMTGLVKRKR